MFNLTTKKVMTAVTAGHEEEAMICMRLGLSHAGSIYRHNDFSSILVMSDCDGWPFK